MAIGLYGTRESELNELGHKLMKFITQELHNQGVYIPSMVRFKFYTAQRLEYADSIIRIEIVGNGKTLAISRVVHQERFISDEFWMEKEAKTMAAQIMLSGGCTTVDDPRRWVDEAAKKMAETIDNRVLGSLKR